MTFREQYIQALIEQLRLTPGFPAVVERSLDEAFAREDGQVLVIHRGREDPDARVIGMTDRTSDICLSVVTRGAAPDRIADAVMEMAHPLVMRFYPPGVMDVQEGPTDEPKYGGGGDRVCMITTHYAVRYRTRSDSLVA